MSWFTTTSRVKSNSSLCSTILSYLSDETTALHQRDCLLVTAGELHRFAAEAAVLFEAGVVFAEEPIVVVAADGETAVQFEAALIGALSVHAVSVAFEEQEPSRTADIAAVVALLEELASVASVRTVADRVEVPTLFSNLRHTRIPAIAGAADSLPLFSIMLMRHLAWPRIHYSERGVGIPPAAESPPVLASLQALGDLYKESLLRPWRVRYYSEQVILAVVSQNSRLSATASLGNQSALQLQSLSVQHFLVQVTSVHHLFASPFHTKV